MTGRDEPLNLGILGNQGRICGLAINKPNQAPYPKSLIGITTVN